MLCSDAMRQSFMECDQAKNDPSSCYHVREPDTRVLDMTFPEFENCVGQWSRRRLCLQVSCEASVRAHSETVCVLQTPESRRLCMYV